MRRATFLTGQQPRRSSSAGRGDGPQRRGRCDFEQRRRRCATASARSPISRRTRTSIVEGDRRCRRDRRAPGRRPDLHPGLLLPRRPATTATAPTSPATTRSWRSPEVLAAFLGQFYDNKPPPPLMLLSHEPAETRAAARGAVDRRPGARSSSPCRSAATSAKLVEHAVDQRARGARRAAWPRARLAAAAAGRRRGRVRASTRRPSGSRSTTTATSGHQRRSAP